MYTYMYYYDKNALKLHKPPVLLSEDINTECFEYLFDQIWHILLTYNEVDINAKRYASGNSLSERYDNVSTGKNN